jgi:hypothetical protein
VGVGRDGGKGGGRGAPSPPPRKSSGDLRSPELFIYYVFFIILEKHPFNIKMLIEYFTHQEYIIDLIT